MMQPIIPSSQNAAANAMSVGTGLVLPLGVEALRSAAVQLWGNVKTYEAAEVKKLGALGRRVWMDITLGERAGRAAQWNYKYRGKKESVPVLTVDCCLVEITATKEIVKSMPMGGSRAGSVKEYVNMGDYQVSIKGILASKDGSYPLREVKILNQYIKAPVQIPVTHELLYELGIYEIVIESFTLPARPGFENLQAFELQCLSDYPVELEIKNKKALT